MSCSFIAVISGADIQDRISSGIKCPRALEGPSKIERIPCLLPRFHVQEIDITVHAGIDDFDQIVLLLRPVIHRHVLLLTSAPPPEKRLSSPSGSGPGCRPDSQGTGLLGPDSFNGGVPDIRMAIRRIVTEVISPKGHNSVHICIILRHPELNIRIRYISRRIIQDCPIHFNPCRCNVVGRLG